MTHASDELSVWHEQKKIVERAASSSRTAVAQKKIEEGAKGRCAIHMFELVVVIAGAIFLIIIGAIFCVHVVSGPAESVTITWPGRKVCRVLKDGIYILSPLEQVHFHRWSYQDQCYVTRYVAGDTLPTCGTQVDIAPIECLSSDNQPVSLDPMLVYLVSDSAKAVIRSADPLLLLCQQVAMYARQHVALWEAAQVSKQSRGIGKAIVEDIAREWTKDYGLALERCEIQSISTDEETIRRRRKMRDGLSMSECTRLEEAEAYAGVKTRVRVHK